jgi:hypothetical protein
MPPWLTTRRSGLVVAQNTAKIPVLLSSWMLKPGNGTLRVSDDMRARSGNIVQTIAYRYAAVQADEPGPFNVTANSRNADGDDVFDIDVSAVTDQLWVQAALMAHTSDGAVGYATSMIQAQIAGKSFMAGVRTIEVEPELNASESAYYEVGDPFPVLGCTNLQVAVVATGIGGTVTYRPAFRSFKSSYSVANQWADLGTAKSSTGDEKHNFGTTGVTPGTNQFGQAGLKVTATGRGYLTVFVVAIF